MASTPIGDQITFGRAPSLAQRSNPSRAAENERPAIDAVSVGYADCIKSGRGWRATFMPGSEPAFIQVEAGVQEALARLFQGGITYGEFNTHYAALRATGEQRLAAIADAYRREQDNFQRQLAIARITAPPLPPPPQMTFTPVVVPMTTTTTCRSLGGGQIECKTR